MYNQSYNKQKQLNETWNTYVNEQEQERLDEFQLPGMSFVASFMRSLGSLSFILSKAASFTNNQDLAQFAQKLKQFYDLFVQFEKDNPILMKFIIAGDILGSVKGKGMEWVIDKIAASMGKPADSPEQAQAPEAGTQQAVQESVYDDAILDDGTLVCAGCLQEHLESDRTLIQEAKYQGRTVTLNKPTKGDVKKFKVYVKDPSTGNVKKVNFGDPNMKIKKNIPARRKSFRARHNCANPGPKTKARYWSCKKW